MLNKETLTTLKRTNAVKDPEKAKTRIDQLWKDASKDERNEILNLSGLNEAATKRAYKLGNAQPRFVAALAQVLKHDPLYIIGEADEERPYDDSIVIGFLHGLGYSNIKGKSKRAKPVKAKHPVKVSKSESSITDESALKQVAAKNLKSDSQTSSINIKDIFREQGFEANFPNMQERLDDLTEEDCMLLLKGCFVQASYDEAKQIILMLVKFLLIQ